MKYDIITMGSATVDVFCNSDSELLTVRTVKGNKEMIAYPLGTKILIKDLDFKIGGGGTNSAVAFSRLGFKTAYLGSLGNDDNKINIVDYLRKAKIEFIGTTVKAKTNYSVVLDSKADDRTILVYRNAADKLSWKKIDKKEINARWIYSSSQRKESRKAFEKVCSHVKKKGTKICYNPGTYQARKGLKTVKTIMRHCNVFVLNKEEAELFVGSGEMKHVARKLSVYGPEYVVITDGKKGAYCYNHDKLYFLKSNDRKIVETTGAGDAFASTFIAGLEMFGEVEKAMKIASINAESVITHFGPKEKLLSRKEILNKLKKDRRKVKIC